MKDLKKNMMELMDEYEHSNTSDGVQTILDIWAENKANLISVLSRHPNWDAENYRIVFSKDYERGFDSSAISYFREWAVSEWLKTQTPYMIDGHTVRTYKSIARNLDNANDHILALRRINEAFGMESFDPYIVIRYNGEEYSTLRNLVDAMSQRIRDSLEHAKSIDGCHYPNEVYDKYCKLSNFFMIVGENATGNLLSAELAVVVNEIFPSLKAVGGQKIMKVIRKVCVMYGLDKIVDMREESYRDQSGTLHTREKDFGFNYRIAQLGDKINPLKISRHTIISVNPLDYLTMSFGHKWASCHTIDKKDKRNVRNNQYGGCYCSGTLSYMLDSSSIVFYTVDSEYDGNDFETQDKMQRCMFHINTDGTVMVQGRVYPDGRDGGDASYAAQFRNVMQTVIAQCMNHNNLWVCKKGTNEIDSYVRSYGTHYRDYEHYDDCTVSLLKGVETYKRVYIGHDPICPNCGEEHTNEGFLCCEDCQDVHRCPNCGDIVNERDGIEINGEWYCNCECAEEAGYRYVDGYGWCDEDDCYCDDYNNEYYYGTPEVTTEDGNYYSCVEHAERDGYSRTDDGDWYPESEVLFDEYHEVYFHRTSEMVEIGDRYFEDADMAEDAGYVRYGDGEWYSSDDMVTDARTGELFPEELDGAVHAEEDDVWFIDETSAREAGYHKHSDGEWYKEEEVAA